MVKKIPPVGYLTFADKFMILAYFILLISFIFNVTLLELTERKKEDLVKTFHHYTEYSMFILVPLLCLILFLFLL